MVLLVLTSCGMKDRKQTYPRDEGVTQQQEQAGGQSEKHEAPGTEPGLSRKPAEGGGGNAAGAGKAGGAGNASAAGNAGTAGGTGAAGNAAPAGGAEPERPGTAVILKRIEYIISQRRYYGHDEGVLGGFLCLDGIFLLLYPFRKLKYIVFEIHTYLISCL